MLQTIRDNTQGWISGVIISILILTFAVWGIHSYFVGGGNNSDVAEVNGSSITKEQLAVAYERLRRNIQLQYGANNPLSAKDESNLKSRALQVLIDAEVLKQASAAQGFRVYDRQIDNYLQGIPDFQVDGRFSVERFQEFLSSSMLSTSEFLDLIRTSLLVGQPKLGILSTEFALPDEATYTIALVNQEREIDYINIPTQKFMTAAINIPQAKIQAYYEQHKNDFLTPEQVNIDFIQLSLKDLADKIKPTDSMLNSFYNENINSYTLPIQWKYVAVELPLPVNAANEAIENTKKTASVIADGMRAGEDPKKLAIANLANMTIEGLKSLSQVPAELQKAVADFTKPGQVSAPIVTSKSVIILKALAIQEPKMQAFAEVKDKVRDAYVRQHAEEKFAELRDKMADLTYEHPDNLQFAAKELALPIQTSDLFTKDKPGKDISQFKKVREASFSNDVMNLQNNSDVIQLNPESMVVLRVRSHVPSSLLPLEGIIAKEIKDKLTAQAAEAEAEKYANDLQAKLSTGSDAKALAAANNLTWNQTGLLGRYSTKVDTAILDLAFRLPNPSTNQGKMIYGVTRIPNGYAIVALKNVKDGVMTDKKQYSVFAEQYQNSEALLEYELYMQSQRANAKISVG